MICLPKEYKSLRDGVELLESFNELFFLFTLLERPVVHFEVGQAKINNQIHYYKDRKSQTCFEK